VFVHGRVAVEIRLRSATTTRFCIVAVCLPTLANRISTSFQDGVHLTANQDAAQVGECLLHRKIVLSLSFDFAKIVHDRGMVAAAEGLADLFVACLA
jgi:hypothetical protein